MAKKIISFLMATLLIFSLVACGNTSQQAEKRATYIKNRTGADILELVPANLPDSISEYDTVFVGYPIWWHTAPMIIGTFLEKYDLTGVEIYPFSQSASMDTEQFDNSMDFVRENATGGKCA